MLKVSTLATAFLMAAANFVPTESNAATRKPLARPNATVPVVLPLRCAEGTFTTASGEKKCTPSFLATLGRTNAIVATQSSVSLVNPPVPVSQDILYRYPNTIFSFPHVGGLTRAPYGLGFGFFR